MEQAPQASGGCPPALLSGPIARTLLVFALPALGTCLLQSVNGSINAIWIGRLLGGNALAAASSGAVITMAVSSIVFGLGSAVSVLIGQATGRGDSDEVRRVYATALSLFLFAGIVLGSLGCWLTPDILRWVATPDEVLPEAERYLAVHFGSLPATFLFVLLMMLLRGSGDLRTPLWYMGLNVSVDIALNPLLIGGFGALPALGIQGSAIAGLIASYLSMLGLAMHVHLRARVPRLQCALWSEDQLRQCRAILRSIIEKGSMMGLQLMIVSFAGVVLLSLINPFGSATAAAYGAVKQLWMFIQMPASALAMAVGSMAAINIGAQRWDRLQAIARSGLIITLLVGMGVAVLSLLFARPFLSLYLQDAASLDAALRINRIGIAATVISGMAMVPSAIVRANGAVQVPVLACLVAIVFVKLGLAFALRHHLGSDAIWWALVAGAVSSLGLMSAYYRWGNWRSLRLIRQSRDASAQLPSSAASPLLGAAVSR